MISLRPVEPSDGPFLEEVYASTRRDELALLPWTADQKAAFVHMQSVAQHRQLQQFHPNAAFAVILRDGAPAGRLYVDRRPDDIRVLDIALLAEHRGGGVGTSILEGLLREGDRTGRPVRLRVARLSPARRLYERLGFVGSHENELDIELERLPAAGASSISASGD